MECYSWKVFEKKGGKRRVVKIYWHLVNSVINMNVYILYRYNYTQLLPRILIKLPDSGLVATSAVHWVSFVAISLGFVHLLKSFVGIALRLLSVSIISGQIPTIVVCVVLHSLIKLCVVLYNCVKFCKVFL